MVVSRRDEAISEVIGFVLILALIAIVASLYLTYVVPAQGRDMEIAHMDVVQDQFLSYKTTVDSLWINNRYNTQISSPFTLGTNPGSTQGSFVNMPLFQPVTSGGTLVVNGRSETIGVNADALFTQGTVVAPPNNNPDIQIEPEHLFVSFSTTDIRSQANVSISPSKGSWVAYLITTPGAQTPLNVTIVKNGTMNNLTIQNSITNYSSYQIDLADSVFGLKEAFQYPFSLTISNPSIVTRVTPAGYYAGTGVAIIPLNTPMGSLEYRSSNNYWISQNYIYQYGGVFLQQDNGSVVKLLPSITVTRDSKNPTLTRVTINNITINKKIPSIIGGSSLVEVLTTLKKPDIVSNNLVNSQEYGSANARVVTIIVTADNINAAQMWKSTFEKIRLNSGYSPNWVNVSPVTPDGNRYTVTMTVGDTNSGVYNIVLDGQSSVAIIELSPTSY